MKQVLYFSASWCAPCKQMAHIIDNLSQKIPIRKIDVDSNPQLTSSYSIRSVPTFILVEDGKELKRLSGIQNELQLNRFYGNL